MKTLIFGLFAILLVAGCVIPRASFIDPANVREFGQTVTGASGMRCQNPQDAVFAVKNPSNIPVDSATAIVTIIGVDSSVNNMWVGTHEDSPVAYRRVDTSEVYNSAGPFTPLDVFTPSEKRIDGNCRWDFTIKYKISTTATTLPAQPTTVIAPSSGYAAPIPPQTSLLQTVATAQNRPLTIQEQLTAFINSIVQFLRNLFK